MPASNMGSPFSSTDPNKPAGTATLASNPNTGVAVLMSAFSGPAGSPFGTEYSSYGNTTGALNTGIGFGVGMGAFHTVLNEDSEIRAAGYRPGVSLPYVPGVVNQAATTSILVAIGGGKSTFNPALIQPYVVSPYTAGFGLCDFGGGDGTTNATTGGGSRDVGGGAGFFPQYAGPAAGSIPNGTAITAGFVNRSNVVITAGQYMLGSSTASNGVPA